MSYQNILKNPMSHYNYFYKQICKAKPYISLEDKKFSALRNMFLQRGISQDKLQLMAITERAFNQHDFVAEIEVGAVAHDLDKGIERYYVKDDSLFDFFRNTPVRDKEVQSVLDSFNKESDMDLWGVIGQNFACTIIRTMDPNGKNSIIVLTDEYNHMFVPSELLKEERGEMFNLAMNFLFYINAFPECVIDGVPNGVKRNLKAKSISVSDKIVSHTTVERGFVRPHFRSGYFRHFNSDWYVNCKGQVRFIASTMVKGKAKTVIER